MREKNNIFELILTIVLIIFGAYIAIQLIRKIFGGSWTTESIIISLTILILASLFVITGFLINQSKSLGKLESKFDNLKNSFCSLAKDFKEHLTNHKT